MDLMPLFKAYVKTAQLQSMPVPDKNRILKKHGKNSEAFDFLVEAENINKQIDQLEKVLLENRAAYMEYAAHLKDSPKMTDAERDVLDAETTKIITICTQLINDFRMECRNRKLAKQFAEHLDGVIDILMSKLKSVETMHNQQREHRVQRQLETLKFLKLGSGKKPAPKRPMKKDSVSSTKAQEVVDDEEEDDVATDANARLTTASLLLATADEEQKSSPNVLRKRISNRSASLPLDDEEINNSHSFVEDLELNPDDMQLLEQENKQLYTDLQGLSDEVEMIQKNVVGIAKLQDLFTEKVVLQKGDIERIANTVVGATENVKDANEQIKQAIQRNAGLRVYVLFFLLVMSFTLLFLDWYND